MPYAVPQRDDFLKFRGCEQVAGIHFHSSPATSSDSCGVDGSKICWICGCRFLAATLSASHCQRHSFDAVLGHQSTRPDIHSRLFMADHSWPLIHGRSFMADHSWPIIHGRNLTGGITSVLQFPKETDKETGRQRETKGKIVHADLSTGLFLGATTVRPSGVRVKGEMGPWSPRSATANE